MVNSLHWPFSTVKVRPKKFFFTQNIIDFDTFLQSKFRSCCPCVFLLIHSFRLSLPWNSPGRFRKNDCAYCLSSCTFRSLSSLSGLLLYWNNIFIENSFGVVLSKPKGRRTLADFLSADRKIFTCRLVSFAAILLDILKNGCEGDYLSASVRWIQTSVRHWRIGACRRHLTVLDHKTSFRALSVDRDNLPGLPRTSTNEELWTFVE